MTIIVNNKNLIDNAKLEYFEKYDYKIINLTKNNIKYQSYISCMYFNYE